MRIGKKGKEIGEISLCLSDAVIMPGEATSLIGTAQFFHLARNGNPWYE